MSANPRFLPCPFCGHKKPKLNRLVLADDSVSFMVLCVRCGAQGPHSVMSRASELGWNGHVFELGAGV